ncbi:hypothetical protein SRHO_G00259460 [Serrasalmus rhombeus]
MHCCIKNMGTFETRGGLKQSSDNKLFQKEADNWTSKHINHNGSSTPSMDGVLFFLLKEAQKTKMHTKMGLY